MDSWNIIVPRLRLEKSEGIIVAEIGSWGGETEKEELYTVQGRAGMWRPGIKSTCGRLEDQDAVWDGRSSAWEGLSSLGCASRGKQGLQVWKLTTAISKGVGVMP